jgi:hypothetical protein
VRFAAALALCTVALTGGMTMSKANAQSTLTIDDFSRSDGRSALDTPWSVFSDRVMGGVSVPEAGFAEVEGRRCLGLSGDVRLENNGGFIQAAVPLASRGSFDGSPWDGVELEVYGNDERYSVHLKTTDLSRPWQYYAASFDAVPAWRTVRLPFASFEAKATRTPLAAARLTRLGLVASGRPFTAALCVAAVRLYRDAPGT